MTLLPMLTGKARVAGIMGWPVSHSRSPRLHGYWIAKYGVDAAYIPFKVRPDEVERALRAFPVLGFAGCNLTLPHKERALAVVDEVDQAARRIGAMNLLVVGEDGRLRGRNTDGLGFLAALRDGAASFEVTAGPALVLGAGGAAKAIVASLVDAGAPEVRIANRTRARAEKLADGLGAKVIEVIDWEARAAGLDGAALLVNATSLGMQGQPPLELDLGRLPPEAVVNDAIYTPLETGILAAARARGNRTVDGLGMLLHQATYAFEEWFGILPEVTAELRAHVLG
jgi:shikimate dehydrogenase